MPVRRRHRLKDMKVNLRMKENVPLGRARLSDIDATVSPEGIIALNEDLDGAYRSIVNQSLAAGIDPSKIRHVKVVDAEIGTSETPIAHSLGIKPHKYNVVMKNSSAWYQTREPDAQNLYLAASAAVTADITVEG